MGAPSRHVEHSAARPAGDRSADERVAIAGGGIAGLASAHYLLDAGFRVVLFESTDRLGGLGTFFAHEDRTFERFYHVVLPSDEDLLRLAGEIGAGDRFYWKESSLGLMVNRKIYRMDGPLDLLRFRALPLADRLRLGFAAVYTASLSRPEGLDDVTARAWLTRLAGHRAYERLYKPLLEAKFGAASESVPALWYWHRFNREKGVGREIKGYPRGGYKGLADTIAGALSSRGADLRLEAPIDRVDLDIDGRPVVTVAGAPETFDRLVSTLPLPLLRQVAAGGEVARRLERVDPGIDYQGVVNVVLLLERGLSPYYWIPVIDSGAPFQGIVETSRVIDSGDTGGHHLVYLLNYAHRSSPVFDRDPDELANEYTDALFGLFPDADRGSIRATYVFRTPFVEPIYGPGYTRRKPPIELVPGRVYLATTTQVYPRVTSWNSSTRLAREVVAAVVAHRESPR